MVISDCPRCNGSGKGLRCSFGEIIPVRCGACKGTGKLEKRKGKLVDYYKL